MDRNRHASITEVPFRATAGAPPGAEVLALAALANRARGHDVDAYSPMRPAFHHLIAVRSGRLTCSVDFTDHAVTDGDWLWVRPGQILQFRSGLTTTEGTVVLFQPGFLGAAATGAARVDRPALRTEPLHPPEAAQDVLQRTLDLLESEYGRLAELPLEMHIEVVRHLLSVLLLRLAHLQHGQDEESGSDSDAFRRFQQAVERDFARTHRVEDYARQLGYSVRTLTRATRVAAGCGAKRFIDDRVLLEAKRLLVHTTLTASAVGERLGFPDPTVFTKFFRSRTGETPAAFRLRAKGTAS
ncbi:helix-turn-helix transcriptional regulator [Streptomyces sclerotialus]|uniref:helix-turn-helix transcriptional regulator n=1 Tax=Streptomyces sclerotialus TaxID=1957 RepID=UPI0004C48B90